jgi:ABC-type transport system involved in multi-copper enzyme maturation permease subunit
MSDLLVDTTTDDIALGKGSLLRSEMHRLVSRRFIRWLLLLATATYLLITVIVGLTQFAKSSDEGLAKARVRLEQAVADQNAFRQDCANDDNRPADVPVDEACGPEATASDFRVEDFVDPKPFVLRSALPDVSIAVGVATAALAFLIGATYVGAEWSSRSMVALLFWEPRRMRVMAAKLTVLAGAVAAIALAGQLVWLASAEILAGTRGTSAGLPKTFWSDLVQQQARTVFFVVIMALLGFGIANLIRHTAAALGVAFVYIAILEPAVRIARPRWQQWLYTDNVVALLSKHGNHILLGDSGSFSSSSSSSSDPITPPHELVLSNLHGALVLGLVTAAIVLAGIVSFQRRDLH